MCIRDSFSADREPGVAPGGRMITMERAWESQEVPTMQKHGWELEERAHTIARTLSWESQGGLCNADCGRKDAAGQDHDDNIVELGTSPASATQQITATMAKP